jgi:hypothetical protein
MKNIVLKTCLTALAFSVAGLANANTDPIDLLTYSVISGGAVNIAAQPDYVTAPNVGGHIAGQAAVVIGAYTTVNDVYAGAAVTTGAWSRVKHIDAGAAAGVGANAFALDVDAGAAVVVGANGQVGTITAGAAITLGAGAGHQVAEGYAGVVTRGAGSTFNDYSGDYGQWKFDAGTATGKIKTADDMTVAMDNIVEVLERTADIDPVDVFTNTDLSNGVIEELDGEDTFYYSAINLQANTTLTIDGNVTVITSEAMTMGAGAEIVLLEGAQVTWILGGSLNLGAGSKFSGETYVKGAVNGATSDVQCGNLYATGEVSVRSVEPVACLAPVTPVRKLDGVDVVCPLWRDDTVWNAWVLAALDITKTSSAPTQRATAEDIFNFVIITPEYHFSYYTRDGHNIDSIFWTQNSTLTYHTNMLIHPSPGVPEMDITNYLISPDPVTESRSFDDALEACNADFNTLFSL